MKTSNELSECCIPRGHLMESMNDEKSGCKLCATFIYLSDSECTCSEKAAEATAALLVSACAHPSLALTVSRPIATYFSMPLLLTDAVPHKLAG